MISPINGNHADFQMLQSMAQQSGNQQRITVEPAKSTSVASQSSTLQCRLDGELHEMTFCLAVLQTGQDGGTTAVDSNRVTSLNANLV